MKKSIKNILFLRLNKISRFIYNKILSKIPGLKIEALLYKIATKKGFWLIEVQDNKMYVNIKDGGITPFLVRNGVYEEYESKIFKNLIKNDTLLIDVGANIGYYTLLAANIIREGTIYAFEPVKDNYELLIKNLALNNYDNVKTIQKAISNKKGKIKIYLDEKNLGNHSLAINNVPDEIDFIDVETTTLDAFFNDLEETTKNDIIIKIDTQGAEGLVIEGAQQLLLNDNVKIFMEFWPTGLRNMGSDPFELLKKLEDYGFKIKLIDEKTNSLKNVNKKDIIRFCDDPVNKIDQLNLLLEKEN